MSCVLQLAGQSVDAFIAKRNYHAMPQHEDVWAAPVSDMPAAYNLHARMQALAEQQQQEQAEDTLQEPEQDHHQAAREQQPRKAMQPVRNLSSGGMGDDVINIGSMLHANRYALMHKECAL